MPELVVKLNSVETSTKGFLRTTELGGCLVVAVYSEYSAETKEGVLTHYAPFMTEFHLAALRTALRPSPAYRKSALFYKRLDSNVTTLAQLLKKHSAPPQLVQYHGYHEQVILDVRTREWQTNEAKGTL